MNELKKYKISIVTAVYNVEEYLGEMIESIISQSIGFENIQLILVDDGSTDDSGSICDQYKELYPNNIIVVHKENGGVSSARNEGLKYIKGEYVNFTDSDDMLEENALEEMYNYLKENEKWIDLVAIRMNFFGAVQGSHILNYRFKTTRVIDLRKEYASIHLSMSCALVKKDCLQNRCFDINLAYGEDAQLVLDILLDKMCYGVVSGTSYLYRKRDSGGSALDLSGSSPNWYIPCIEKFILRSLENAMAKRGYIPQFIQYACMYDLQWRLQKNPLVNDDVLNEKERELYKTLLIKSLQYISANIILEQKSIGDNLKIAILSLKKEYKNKKELIFYPNDAKICIQDISFSASSYSMNFEFIYILPEKIIIEGYIRYFKELEGAEIFLKTSSEQVPQIEYKAELFARKEKYSFFMNEVITLATGFRFCINRSEMPNDLELLLCLHYQGQDIVWKNLSFGKFFPLSKQLKSSFFYESGILVTYSENVLHISKGTKKLARRCEKNFQKEMLSKRKKMIFRGWIARNMYHILKLFKRKELWLISDRLTKADDNGEAFFTYMNTIGRNSKITTYFVLDKNSEDYKRIRKIGKVVPFHSTKHKILSLLCDKIISAHAEDYIFNRFFNLSYLYKDIQYRQKFVFLQHGVTKDDMSRWLAKENKNIDIFVTVTNMEYQSILDCAYHYDTKQVKCVGFPRYDYLYDNTTKSNIITFMPTWRSYLVSNINVNTDSRMLKSGFENSTYCQMYKQVFSDSRLYEAAEKYHYKLEIMLHPAMPEECIEYFNCSNIKILDKNTRYRELFANSKLIVTDYSSAVFDFAYLRKPILYFQQDVAEFYSGKHVYDKGYFDYERDGFGEVEYTADVLVDRLIEYMKNGCQLKEIYRERIEKTFPYNDQDNCKRLYEEIIKL